MITLVLAILLLFKEHKAVADISKALWGYTHNIKEVLSIILVIWFILFLIYLISEYGQVE